MFHGFLYRDEALAAAFGGNNMKVQLILLVSQAWYFCHIICHHVIRVSANFKMLAVGILEFTYVKDII